MPCVVGSNPALVTSELVLQVESRRGQAPQRGDLVIRAAEGGSQRVRRHESPVSAASEVRDASKGHAPQGGARAWKLNA